MNLDMQLIYHISLVLLVFVAIAGAGLMTVSAVRMSKQKKYYTELHADLKAGQRVLFGNGMYGKLVAVHTDTCDIELKSGAVVEVSRYVIQKIDK